jgi:hypothetical protein
VVECLGIAFVAARISGGIIRLQIIVHHNSSFRAF